MLKPAIQDNRASVVDTTMIHTQEAETKKSASHVTLTSSQNSFLPPINDMAITIALVPSTTSTRKQKHLKRNKERMIETEGQKYAAQPSTDCMWYHNVKQHIPDALREPDKTKPPTMTIDANVFSVKKTVMTILCLIIIILLNSVQLRNVSKEGSNHPFYKSQLALGVLSVALTSAIGVILMYTARVNYNDQYKQRKLDYISNVLIIMLFLLAIFNIFIVACN